MPGRGHPGTYGRPPLSLDLHYLLTGYGTREEAGAVLERRRALEWLFQDVPWEDVDLGA